MNTESIRRATVTFFLKGNEVNLPVKKKNIGAGFRNGYGGHVKEDESPEYAAVRETLEESHSKVTTHDLNLMAILSCHSRTEEGQAILYLIYVYWTKFWKGEPEETDEMGRPEWFPMDILPTSELMLSDRTWLPRFFRDGVPLAVTVHYGPKQLTLEKEVEIKEVSEFPEE